MEPRDGGGKVYDAGFAVRGEREADGLAFDAEMGADGGEVENGDGWHDGVIGDKGLGRWRRKR